MENVCRLRFRSLLLTFLFIGTIGCAGVPKVEQLTPLKPGSELSLIQVGLVKKAPESESSAKLVGRARLSVLTIFAGDGHGSGFIVSRDGYVLTNQHVVGDARVFTAKMLTGREVSGEVIRIDRPRDVALLKLEQGLYTPLPVGHSSMIRPGTEVYAFGSPWAERCGQSVSRGVVGGFRSEQDQRFIQSEVLIHPGNSGGPLLSLDGFVVAIAAQAMLRGGAGIGINLFIPIEEALAALRIEAPETQTPTTQKSECGSR